MGGSQVINILIGILRTKVMAVLLGPAGVGLLGMYQAVTGVVGTVTGLGIGSSGVRQIAEAAGTGDEIRIATTIYTLRRTALILGLAGMLFTIALCRHLSTVTFGSENQADAIAFLGITILLGAVSGGQVALVQGLQRITDLAAMSVLGTIFSTILSVLILYFWQDTGIVPSLIAVSAMTILTSWWFARKIRVPTVSIDWKEVLREGKGLVKLGGVFMASELMTAAVAYFIRVLITRKLGMESLGLYQAANTLSNLYIGVILGAMGMDFYPRLTAVASDNPTVNRMVNEQTEVGLLVATPGIVATLAFAPHALQIFYSSAFMAAFDVLRWQILGIFLRVVAWPMGFVVLAKGKNRVFFWTELIWNALHAGLVWAGVHLFGLAGTGIAFFWMYVSYTILIFVVVNHISGFRWSKTNIRISAIMMAIIAAAFLVPHLLPKTWAMLLNSLFTLIATGYSIRKLYRLAGIEWLTDFGFKIKN